MKSLINKTVSGAAVVALTAPVALFAQGGPAGGPATTNNTGGAGLQGVLTTVSSLVNMVVPIILTLAIIYFMWGLLQYLTKAGEEQAKARDQMIWGIVAIAVMVSIWGLVGILQSTFGIEGQNTPLVPATVQIQ